MFPQKLIFVLLIVPLWSYAQTIEKINVQGNSAFSKNDYLQWAKEKEGNKTYAGVLDSIKKRVSLGLMGKGYFHSGIDVSSINNEIDSQKVSLNIIIREGEPTYVNKINILGVRQSDSIKINRLFDFQLGQVFDKSDLENSFSQILDYFEERGFPFARIIISSIDFSSNSLIDRNLAEIYLKIDPGKFSKIDRIEIQGNSKTADYVILREARLQSGIDYSQKSVEEIPKKLNRLRFFEPVEVPSFYFNSRDEGILAIQVKEKQTNNFDGIIGYLPGNNQDEKGYLTGLVNVTLRNMFGTGRAAAIKWQQTDRYSQQLELRYLEPWILGYPFNVNLGLSQQKQDSSYVQRRVEVGVEFLANENISASLIFANESVIPTENANPVFTVFNSTITSSGINLKIDTRDDYYSPTEGIYMLNSYSFSRKRINGPSRYITASTKLNTSLQRFSFDFGVYKEIFRNQVLALTLHARELKGEGFEVSDLYRLGGTNTLRGYRENQFLANRLIWTNLEFRQPFSKRSYGFLFFDSGYYLRVQDVERNILRSSDFKMGYGLGLNLDTGLGVLSVSYALAKGDSFSQGKIHFGLVNEF